jgi:hypothetical protein
MREGRAEAVGHDGLERRSPLRRESGVGRLISRLKAKGLTAVARGIRAARCGGQERAPARHELRWLTSANAP